MFFQNINIFRFKIRISSYHSGCLRGLGRSETKANMHKYYNFEMNE